MPQGGRSPASSQTQMDVLDVRHFEFAQRTHDRTKALKNKIFDKNSGVSSLPEEGFLKKGTEKKRENCSTGAGAVVDLGVRGVRGGASENERAAWEGWPGDCGGAKTAKLPGTFLRACAAPSCGSCSRLRGGQADQAGGPHA